MAKVDKNPESLKKNRWLRAIQLAKILFDDEGYFIDYLDQIEEFIKNKHPEINRPTVEFGIKNKEIIWVNCRHREDCHDYQTFTSEDAALLVIDIATWRLSYNMDIGKPFPSHHMRIAVCIDERQIICKIQPPAEKHETTN